MSDALLEAAKEFNKLPDGKKWEQWKAYKGLFVCPYCRPHNTPERCSPFCGNTMHCDHCNEELSRRTGGGQNDPFGWILETETETTEAQTVTQSQAAEIVELKANPIHALTDGGTPLTRDFVMDLIKARDVTVEAYEAEVERQTAEIAALSSQVEKWSGWFTYTAELLGVEPTQTVVAATIAEQEKTIERLTGEVERLRHLFQVIDESYGGGPSTRAGHMLVVFSLVQKALSNNNAGGEGE